MIQTASHYFGLQSFANVGHCTLTPRRDLFNQHITHWDPTDGIVEGPRVAWLRCSWDGKALQIVRSRGRHRTVRTRTTSP